MDSIKFRAQSIRAIKYFLIFLVAVLAIVNSLVLYKFLKWIDEFEACGSVSFDFSHYLAVQAHQNSILQVYLVVFSIGLGVLAFYGYFQIREAAEKSAERKAEEVAKAFMETYLKDSANIAFGKPSFTYNQMSHTSNEDLP